MAVRWSSTFVCDGCGKESEGRHVHCSTYCMPSVWNVKPDGWLRTYGYDLCDICGREHEIGRRVNKLFNDAIHKISVKDSEVHHVLFRRMRDECKLKKLRAGIRSCPASQKRAWIASSQRGGKLGKTTVGKARQAGGNRTIGLYEGKAGLAVAVQ